jgi:hypothetical protein
MNRKSVKNVAESPKVLRQAVATLIAERFCKPQGLLRRQVKRGNWAVRNRGE